MDILNAVLWLMIYASFALGIVYLAVKKTRIFIILLGIAAIVGALPVGFLAEINISGCCGASNSQWQGIGYVVAACMALAGVLLIIKGRKMKKNLRHP